LKILNKISYFKLFRNEKIQLIHQGKYHFSTDNAQHKPIHLPVQTKTFQLKTKEVL